MINMEQTNRIDDNTGRAVVRFTPVLYTDCCASGGPIRFAFWEAWADDLKETEDAYRNALKNAQEVLRGYAE